MKRLLSILGISLALSAGAAPPTPTNTVTIGFNMIVDNSQLGGLSTNDFSTNFSAQVVSSPDVTIPTNLWPIVATFPVAPLLSQGSPPSLWTNQIAVDGLSRFFMIRYTNTSNGGAGPFSLAYPLIWPTPGGRLGVSK